MTICVLQRAGMSVFRHLHDFVENTTAPRYFNDVERNECLTFAGIVPLLFSDMRKPWSTTLTATDASPEGFGICETNVLPEEAADLGDWWERWRFKRLAPEQWAPRSRARGRDVFTDPATVVGHVGDEQELDMYAENLDFPEVHPKFLQSTRWSTKRMGRWKHTKEHITTNEGRAVVLALRRLFRPPTRLPPQRVILSKQREVRTLQPLRKDRVTSKGMRVPTVKRVLPVKNSKQKKLRKPQRSVQAVAVKDLVDSKDVGMLARTHRLTKLEQKSISNESRRQYGHYLEKFKGFCLESDGGWPREVGELGPYLADYMDILFQEGKPSHEGEKTLAAVEFHNVQVKGKLIRSRPALKKVGGRSGQRPVGEAIELKKKHVVPPVKMAGNQYAWINVVIRDQESGKPDKVGVRQQPPLRPERLGVGGAMPAEQGQILEEEGENCLFSFSMEEFRKEFGISAQALGLENIHPYQMRHGGATEDLSGMRRDFGGVKVRCRWKTDASVRRYAKIGRVQQLLAELGKSSQHVVRILKLQKRPELNGQLGTVVGWDTVEDRCQVRLVDGSGLLLKACNIELVSGNGFHMPDGGATELRPFSAGASKSPPDHGAMGSSSDSGTSSSTSSDSDTEEEPPYPQVAVDYMDEVGHLFLQSSGLTQWFEARRGGFHFSSDCSGADTPFLGLRYLFEAAGQGHCLIHLSASEIHPQKRQFLRENFKVQQLSSSVLKQNNKPLSNDEMDLYVSGFPCTPYSCLGGLGRLQDKNARQLFACVKRVKVCRPKVSIFENVMGFKVVAAEVGNFIRINCPEYVMVYVALNPRRYGAPISRKRIFLIMVRGDCLSDECKSQDFGDFIQGKLDSMKIPAKTTPINRAAKWIKKHREWAKQQKVSVQKVNKERLFAKRYPGAAKQITSHREMEACNLLAGLHPNLSIINTSQSLDHMPILEQDSQELMCLTPAGKFLSTTKGRYILGRETMLLMGLPVHKLQLGSCSEAVLHSLGGNAMAMRAILPVMCAALSACVPEKFSRG
eukprot:s569_g31.t2